ncbi:MAG: sigma-70 family RNA polymerase sigma factor [Gemmataceae bacterium]
MAQKTRFPVSQFLCRLVGGTSSTESTDRKLLDRFTSRADQDAFTTLVHRHGPMVLGVCRRVLRDLHDAEDAFQATFLVLAQKAKGLRKKELLAAWLHGVAHRTSLKLRGKRRTTHSLETLEVDPVQPSQDFVEWLATEEAAAVIDLEIQRLPERYQKAVVLCFLQGHSHSEAGEILGCPTGTVSTRVARAKDLLRSRLTRLGFPFAAAAFSVGFTQSQLQASVSAPLAISAAQAAMSATSGQLSNFTLTPQVLTLAEEMIRIMLWKKVFGIVAFVLLGVAVLGLGGVGYVAVGSAASNPTPPTNLTQQEKPGGNSEPQDEGGQSAQDRKSRSGSLQAEALEKLESAVKRLRKNFNRQTLLEVETALAQLKRRKRELQQPKIIRVASPTTGIIKRAHLKVGELVKKGTPLVELDNKVALHKLQIAQQSLEIANREIEVSKLRVNETEQQYKRVQKAFQTGVISIEEVGLKRTQYLMAREELRKIQLSAKMAEAEVVLKNELVSRTRIVAPVTGVLRSCKSRGEGVKAFETVAEIVTQTRKTPQ